MHPVSTPSDLECVLFGFSKVFLFPEAIRFEAFDSRSSYQPEMSTSCSSCTLHNLPVGLLATILEKYLDITDWSRLDRAFCSTRNELRNVYLEALKSVKIKIHIVYDTWIWRTINGAQKWIGARGIRITGIRYDGTIMNFQIFHESGFKGLRAV